MNINLKSIQINNFKGIEHFQCDFKLCSTDIRGCNGSGKTTLFDAFTFLLFGKDSSGSEKFDIRMIDADGNTIDGTVISVKAVVQISSDDGLSDVVLEKRIKQKFSKMEDGTKKVSGNVTEYYIDDVPKKLKDYKEFISSIIDEETFRMITNPLAFTSLHWSKQRETLINTVSSFDPVAFASANSYMDEYLSELVRHPVEDLIKRDETALRNMKPQKDQIVARIDSLNSIIVDCPDVDKLKAERDLIEAEIKQFELASVTGSDFKVKQQELLTAITNATSAYNNYIFGQENASQDAKRVLQMAVHDIEREVKRCDSDLEKLNYEIRRVVSQKAIAEKQKASLLEEYKAITSAEFDESQTVCPSCGQELPSDQIAELKDKWQQNLISRRNDNIALGRSVSSNIHVYEETLSSLYEDQSKLRDDRVYFEKQYEMAKLKFDSFSDYDPSKDPKAIELGNAMESAKNAHSEFMLNFGNCKTEESQVISDLRKQLQAKYAEIASAENNLRTQSEINKLSAERKDILADIGNTERRLSAFKRFNMDKINYLSKIINDSFMLVNWKLFDRQLNGAIVECCVPTVDGVPFTSLNTAMQINAGIDIINTLCNANNVTAPIFIDNRESVSELIQTRSQIINLIVDPTCDNLVVS